MVNRSRLLALGIACGLASVVPAASQDRPVSFHKDIEPILQRSCQNCHRPDSVAPMSLLTYQDARPYAREMKRRTSLRDAYGQRGVMPPWFVERNIGVQKFKEDFSLSEDDIAKIAKWADSGAAEGDAKDAPAALKFADANTWFLGKPVLIVSSPEVTV